MKIMTWIVQWQIKKYNDNDTWDEINKWTIRGNESNDLLKGWNEGKQRVKYDNKWSDRWLGVMREIELMTSIFFGEI